MSAVCKPTQGMATADNGRFLRQWFEVSVNKIGFNYKSAASAADSKKKWFPYNKGGGFRKWYGNQEHVVNWENDGEAIKNFNGSVVRNPSTYFQRSISWSKVSSGNIAFRSYPCGFIYDVAGTSLFPNDYSMYNFYLGVVNSKAIRHILDVISPTLNYEVGQIATLPIPSTFNKLIDEEVEKIINISKQDWDAHETSWNFKGNELIRILTENVESNNNSQLTIESALDLYKVMWEDKFHSLHQSEEVINEHIINTFGLKEEITKEVTLDEISILQKGEKNIEDGIIIWNEGTIIKQLISYLVGCFMGRYSIDKPGLIIASQNQDLSSLGVKVEGIDNGATGRIEIDDDGVVPILAGEYFPDDMTVRIEQAIKLIFGEEHFQTNLRYIDEKLGKPLREYLFKDFFNDHIDGKMYQKRPIYWLFSSKMGDKKKKGYFKALVYMHRMESDTLSKLHADYVVPFLAKIEQQHLEAEDLAYRDDLTTAQRNKARKEAEELASQIKEVKEFERELVQMASQRLSFDLDDGVCTNYPKFYPLVEPIKGLDKDE